MWAASLLRRQWRSALVLVVLIAVLGGVALTAAAGARRTDTALRRFVDTTHSVGFNYSPVFPGSAHLPGVASFAELVGEPLLKVLPSGRVDPRFPLPVGGIDHTTLYQIYGVVLRSGRFPDPTRPDEVLASLTAADSEHLHVGSRIRLRDMSGIITRLHVVIPPFVPPGTGTSVTLRVVGVGVGEDDIAASSARSQGGQASFGSIFLTPAYISAHGGPASALYTGATIQARPGITVAELRHELDSLAQREPDVLSGTNYDMSDLLVNAAAIQRTIRPDVVAMWLFAILVGIAAILVIGQVLAREVWAASAQYPTLRALGVARRQFVWGVTAPALAITLFGALFAVVVAIAASPLTPIGPARLAEPQPGFAVNISVLAAGAALVVAGIIAQVLWAARRASAASIAPQEAASTSRLAEMAAAAGLPPPVTTGLRFAFAPGRGSGAVPVRSTVLVATFAVAALVAAVTFDGDLGRLNSTSASYGWNWDLAVDGGYVPLPAYPVSARLAHLPDVAGWAGGNYGALVINGQLLPAVGIDTLHGQVFPSLLAGTPPRGVDQIALGTTTLRSAGAAVGGHVVAVVKGRDRRLLVTGQAVLPDFERGGFAATDLGVGAVATSKVVHPNGIPAGATYNFFLVRYRRGANGANAEASIQRALAPVCARGMCSYFVDRRPHEVNAYGQVTWTPILLSGILGLLAAGALAHALVSSVRRRRREIGILKTLGFTRAQVATAMSWQSSSLVLVVLLIGLPVGALAGRWTWALYAGQLGVATDSLVPWLVLALAVPVALAAGILVAALPAWNAGRVDTVSVLRAE
jgi:ABC-type lipoprotein release transport system permease subunit